MKANQLRIGNKVSYEGSIVTVSTIADDEVTFSDYACFDYPQIEDIPGIELTEEWLVKFGFRKRDNNYRVLWFINSFTLSENEFKRFYFGISEIKYVHQLQNLYFALTGEELKLKQA